MTDASDDTHNHLGHGRRDHGPLCEQPHTCPACEAGGTCVDLFMHPICGLVACNTEEDT